MYKILPHTADIKFRVIANSLGKLFYESLKAINDFLAPEIKKAEKAKGFKVKIKFNRIDFLLIDFLSKILSEVYIKKMIFTLKKIKIKNKTFEAYLIGKSYENLKKDIKAITYHQLLVKKVKNKYIAEFVIDV